MIRAQNQPVQYCPYHPLVLPTLVMVLARSMHWKGPLVLVLVLAFARVPASVLAPMSYTQILWAGLAGVLVFGEWPDGWTILGAGIIAAGGILVAAPQGVDRIRGDHQGGKSPESRDSPGGKPPPGPATGS